MSLAWLSLSPRSNVADTLRCMKLQNCLACSAIGRGEELRPFSSRPKYSSLAFRRRPSVSVSIARTFSVEGLILPLPYSSRNERSFGKPPNQAPK